MAVARAGQVTCRSPSGSSAAPSTRRESRARERPRLGPVRRRVPGHARRPSSATPGSSGDPRGSPRTKPGCSATSATATCSRSARGAGQCSRWVRNRGGRGVRGRPVAPPAAALAPPRRGDRRGRAGGARDGDRAALRRRQLRRRLQLVRGAAVRQRHRRRRWPRPPGCCVPAAATPSRSPTRPGGCSPTTRAGRADRHASPTGTGRRTSRSTTRPATVAYVEHHRTLGDWVAPAGRGTASGSPTCSSPSGPRATTGCGAAGRRSAAGSRPGPRSSGRTGTRADRRSDGPVWRPKCGSASGRDLLALGVRRPGSRPSRARAAGGQPPSRQRTPPTKPTIGTTVSRMVSTGRRSWPRRQRP